MESNKNPIDYAVMIKALASAVLANVSDDDLRKEATLRKLVTDTTALTDYDITCEITRRGLNLDISSLTTETLWEELKNRGATYDADLWELIADKDGIGSKWASENPSAALGSLDTCDIEDHCREWVSENMSEVMEWIDMDLVVDELTRDQKSQLLVALANEARF